MTFSIPEEDTVISVPAPRRLLFVINDLAFLISHRLAVAQAALDAGYDVHFAAPKDLASEQKLAGSGFQLHRLDLRRYNINPFGELRSCWQIYRLYRHIRPDTVHLVTIKPVLYGGLTARITGIPAVVSAISGLGFAFSGDSLKSRIIGRVVAPLYRFALEHRTQRVIFQNDHDRMTLENLGINLDGKAEMIRGSGVDLEIYKPTAEPEGPVIIIVPSRLLHDKGIREFVDAARILKNEGSTARFVLVGDAPARNPGSIPQNTLAAWKNEGVVELWGFRRDMPDVLRQSHIVVLPSYYREGLPKALIEAAACGRPVVTTDTPGCRDAIIANKTGLLIPARNVPALADAMRRLISDQTTRLRMGIAAREYAEEAFSIDHVTHRHLEIYRALSGRINSSKRTR